MSDALTALILITACFAWFVILPTIGFLFVIGAMT